MVLPIRDNSTKETHGVLIMNFAIKNINDLSNRLMNNSIIMITSIFISLAAIAFFIASRFMKPLNKLTRSINYLQEGHMDEEVAVEGYNEIRNIQKALNQML